MILRKPYAFFIKHFKLIHIILAILSCYLIYRTKLVLDFFNDYAANIINVIGQDLTGTLLYGSIYILPFIMIVFTVIILVVMIAKKKPYVFYIVNIVLFLYITIIFQVARSTLLSMELTLIDVRTVRLVRDLISVALIVQIVASIIIVVRAVGFDLKKFGFKEDLHELNIEEEDSEEFEVEFKIDQNKAKRQFRYLFRKTKYAYLENRLLFNIVIAIAVGGISFLVVSAFLNKETVLSQNQYFTGNNLTVSVLNSYLTNTDYKGRVIDKDSVFVILKIKIKNHTIISSGIDIATTKLVIGNYVYTPITKYRDSFIEFGSIYQDENIGGEFEEKVLVYQIPSALKNREMIFSFVDKTNIQKDGLFGRTIVNIKYQDLTTNKESKEYSLGDSIDFENSILNGFHLKIESFDIQKRYKLDYQFCPTSNCISSYEYITPTVTSNYNKSLLKITGTLTTDNVGKIVDVYDPYDFINKFGTLYYTVGEEEKSQPIVLKEVVPKNSKVNNTYYMEVIDEVLNAKKVSIHFQVRNENYVYVLK